jgi:hypothetical protein
MQIPGAAIHRPARGDWRRRRFPAARDFEVYGVSTSVATLSRLSSGLKDY